MLAIALIVIGGLFSFGAACAYLISAAVQFADDASDDEADAYTSHPEVRSPRADRGGGAVVFGVPATSVSTPFHAERNTPIGRRDNV